MQYIPRVSYITIVATSGRCVKSRDFFRHVASISLVHPIYMPHWSFHELEVLLEKIGVISHDQLKENYELCGGVPRLVFCTSTEVIKGGHNSCCQWDKYGRLKNDDGH